MNDTNMKFSLIITNEDYIVRDHQLHQVRAVPGVAFLDIIYRYLIMKKYNLKEVELRNILFKEPIITSADFDKKVVIDLAYENGFWLINAKSCKYKNGLVVSDTWTHNFQAELHLNRDFIHKSIDIHSLKSQAKQVRDIDTSYAFARKAGLYHYEFMKLQGNIYMSDDFFMGEVRLSQLANKYLDKFYMHPAYLDGALTIPGTLGLNNPKIDTADRKPYIPIYIESFRANNRLGKECYVLISNAAITVPKSLDITYHDIEIYDANGDLAAVYKKLGAKRVRTRELILKLENEGNDPAAHDTPISLAEAIEQDITSMAANILGRPAAELAPEEDFYDLGLDSKQLLQIVQDIENKIGKKLYPTLLFEYTSIRSLTGYLESEYGKEYPIASNQAVTRQDLPKAVENKHLDIKQHLLQITAQMLETDINSIDESKDFYDLGLDSKHLLDIVKDLENLLGEKLYPTLLFEYTDIKSLAQYIDHDILKLSQIENKEIASDDSLNTQYPAAREMHPPGGDDFDFFYIPVWMKGHSVIQQSLNDHDNERQENKNNDTILIVRPENCFGLQQFLGELHYHDNVIQIILAAENRKESDIVHMVNIFDKSAIDSVIRVLNGVDTIYFLGGIQPENKDITDLEALAVSQESGVISLFRLVKSLSRNKLLKNLKTLKIITADSQMVLAGDIVNPFVNSISGFVKVLQKEYPKIAISCIDINSKGANGEESYSNMACVSEIIHREYGHINGEEIAVRGKDRYIRKFYPVSIPAAKKIPLKAGGTYLILGGGGGIGLEFSHYLAKEYNANLVLIGRSELDIEQSKKIESIESAGGKVLYLRANASDFNEVKHAVNIAKQRFGKIDGVIHSAIVLRDKLVEKMEESDLLQVLEPKVQGTAVLYKVFESEELDFMCFFSSSQSFLSNIGQSNYASACTFKDAYADAIRQRVSWPVKIINWGYWGSVGVASDSFHNKFLTDQGAVSIQPAEGMEVLCRVLSNSVNQVIALKLDKNVLEMSGLDSQERLRIYPDEIPSLWENMMEQSGHIVDSWPAISQERIAAITSFEQFCVCLLLDFFRKQNVFISDTERYQINELREKMHIISKYYKMFLTLLAILENAGLIKLDGEEVLFDSQNISEAIAIQLPDIKAENFQFSVSNLPEFKVMAGLVSDCIGSYSETLTGECSYSSDSGWDDVISLAQNLYLGDEKNDFVNSGIAGLVEQYVKQRMIQDADAVIQILDFGAEWESSGYVLEKLKPFASNIAYYYSGPTPDQTGSSKVRPAHSYPFLKFIPCDVQSDMLSQGFSKNSMDIILAGSTLHTTKDIGRSLRNLKVLMKNKAILLLNEMTKKQDLTTLTLGLADSWWNYTDDECRVKGFPFSSVAGWKEQLYLCGFTNICVLGDANLPDHEKDQCILMCQSNGMVVQNQSNVISEIYNLNTEKLMVFSNPLSSLTPNVSDESNKDNLAMDKSEMVKTDPITFIGVSQHIDDENFMNFWKNIKGVRRNNIMKFDLERAYLKLAGQHENYLSHLYVNTPSAKQMEVIVAGNGEPVLLLCGFGLTAVQWYYQFKELAHKYRLIVIHTPGTGLSEGGEGISFSDIGNSFMEVLEALEVKGPIHLVASSWGGLVGMTMAVDYKDKIASLILAGCFNEFDINKVQMRDAVRRDFENLNAAHLYHLIIKSEYLNPVVTKYPGYFCMNDIPSKIATPTLVICGKQDMVVDPACSQKLYQSISNAKLIEIEDAGHVPNITNYKVFNKIISEFMDSSGASTCKKSLANRYQ
jgi:pimeloyl-ACP methyl ester carboxylesterase/acyl carrier protein/NADP-dependent 3-hydroxy acid dehydrogenase YdfG